MNRLFFGTPIALAVTASFFAACNSSSGGSPGASFDSGVADTTFAEPEGGGDDASSDGPGIDSTAPDDSGSPANDSGTPASDSGTGGSDTGTSSLDSGTSTQDSSTPADSGSPVDAGVDAPATDAGNVCSLVQGAYQATAVSCNGTAINISSITWILTVNGSSASFSEAVLGGCALISSGSIACVGA